MTEVFQALTVVSFLIAMVVGIPAWVTSIYYLIRTSRSAIQADSAWQRPKSVLAFFRWQPYSPVFDAAQLTPQGLVYRRRLVISVLVFVVPIVAAFVFRALAG